MSSSHLIKAVDFLCGVHWFLASSTRWIHAGAGISPKYDLLVENNNNNKSWDAQYHEQTFLSAGNLFDKRTKPLDEEGSEKQEGGWSNFQHAAFKIPLKRVEIRNANK